MQKKFVALFLFLTCYAASAQEYFRGMVVDSASFAALPYVNIQIKQKLKGTTTDAKGNFAIQASFSDTLILSRVGYKTLEFPLYGYETGLITLAEKQTVLAPITILDNRINANPYQGMFDEQNANLKKRIPFYYSKARKDKIKAANWREESMRVQTYVDLLINTPSTKQDLMKKFKLSEKEYYEVLTHFNEKNYQVMYYLTTGELLSLLNRFFEANAPVK
jgi:hypothetical protein